MPCVVVARPCICSHKNSKSDGFMNWSLAGCTHLGNRSARILLRVVINL